MNKKSVIICISALLLLMAVVAVAVIHLYSGTSDETLVSTGAQTGSITGPKILSAVPADAVIILNSRSLRTTVDMVNDSRNILGAVVGSNQAFGKFLSSLKDSSLRSLEGSDNVISLHYSGSLSPLLIVDIGSSSDTTVALRNILAAASEASLESIILDCRKSAGAKLSTSLLLISPSESTITSSQRHIESGTSVYDRPYFSDAAPLSSGRVTMYIANDQANRIMSSYMSRKSASHSEFFTKFSSWTALSLDEDSEGNVSVQGYLVADEDPANFVNIFRGSPGSDIQALGVLPASTIYAVGISSSKIEEYADDYSRFLDALSHLDSYKAKEQAFRSAHKMSAKQWASRLKLHEVVKAGFRGENGTAEVILARVGKEDSEILLKGTSATSVKEFEKTVQPYAYQGVTGLLFGKGLSLENEEAVSYVNGWLVIGSNAAVGDYVASDAATQSIKTLMGGSSLKNMNCFCYFSVLEDPASLEDIFKPAMAEAIRNSANGLAYEPMLLTIGSSGSRLNLNVTRHEFIENTEVAEARARLDTSVVVPSGPFTVFNCGTQKDNLFIQNPNLSISLTETSGKGIWSIPFKAPLCGRVENIDFYKNGKIQFLFCGGSKLYLIDRLGRFVGSFPLELGKEVRLGPAVYDFSDDKSYSAMVLHTDNTLELYDVAIGKKPESWKTIKATETIKELPELLEADGKKYWVVRTAVQTIIYGFSGGEALAGGKGGRTAIRTDSPLSISGGTLTATCIDGKQRQFKLE